MQKPDLRGRLIRIAALLFVIALMAALFINRDRLQELEAYGYPGIFLLSILANATVIVPLPGVIFTSTMGAIYNPFWVAVVAGLGASIGELSGYLAGFSGNRILERSEWSDRIKVWMSGRYGALTIFLLALIPNPLFDLAGLMAGGLKIPVPRFLFWCALGKILKMMLFAYGGAILLRLIPGF